MSDARRPGESTNEFLYRLIFGHAPTGTVATRTSESDTEALYRIAREGEK